MREISSGMANRVAFEEAKVKGEHAQYPEEVFNPILKVRVGFNPISYCASLSASPFWS